MTMGIQQLMWEIERVGDAFHDAIYTAGDVDAALGFTRDECALRNVPADTGASTPAELRRYLAEDVVAHLPADLVFRRVSRTVDQRRVVAETAVSFTHDREMPWLLPGAAPTGRHAEVLAISVISFKHASRLGVVESRIVAHRTLWDQAGLLAQLGLAPAAV